MAYGKEKVELWISQEKFKLFYEFTGARYTRGKMVKGSDNSGLIVLCKSSVVDPTGLADKILSVSEYESDIVISHNIK